MPRISSQSAFLATTIGATLLTLACPQIARAQAYDATTDFSSINNPNNVWSYGDSATVTSSLVLYTHSFVYTDGIFGTVPGYLVWNDPASSAFDPVPLVGKNTTSSTITFGTVRIPAGMMVIHPGPSSLYSQIQWKAPVAGTYQLSTTFTGIDVGGPDSPSGTTTDVHVLKNGIQLFGGNVVGFGTVQTFSTNVNVQAGDVIAFAVGGGPDTYHNDSTGFSARITVAAPEPSSIAFLVPALLGGITVLRRKRI